MGSLPAGGHGQATLERPGPPLAVQRRSAATIQRAHTAIAAALQPDMRRHVAQLTGAHNQGAAAASQPGGGGHRPSQAHASRGGQHCGDVVDVRGRGDQQRRKQACQGFGAFRRRCEAHCVSRRPLPSSLHEPSPRHHSCPVLQHRPCLPPHAAPYPSSACGSHGCARCCRLCPVPSTERFDSTCGRCHARGGGTPQRERMKSAKKAGAFSNARPARVHGRRRRARQDGGRGT